MSAERFPLARARRWLFFGLVTATSLAGVWVMAGIVGDRGLTVLEVVILLLFAPTFAWIVVPFWTALAGFVLRTVGRDPLTLRGDPPSAPPPTSTLTALVVPIHNEDPDAVAARVSTTIRSLVRTGSADRFHVHLLSDSSDVETATREEVVWLRLQAQHPEMPVHYRRREDNAGRKAGNVGEFCRRCADDYDFMVILDADSLMTGPTLVALAGLMEADPDVGLIQTLPRPVLQKTLFGRLLQLAGCLHGPVLATGQAFWQTDAGNYWGHNAIVRLRPFVEHCELPVLPGRPPLGGEVLSHDFVEGALLRRAGWKVLMAAHLEGSWEEVPGNVVDYSKRDRRWAQGSLQHLRLLGMPGLHVSSRIHFALGAMGYVSSLLWLLLLLAGTAYVLTPGLHGPVVTGALGTPLPGISLLLVTAVILFGPKLLGALDGLLRTRSGFGGPVRLVASALVEGAFSVLMAPIMMLEHARFVAGICIGRSVRWDPQRRDAGTLPWATSWRAAALPTLVGLAWGGATLALSPLFFAWMSPIFVGLILSAPLLRWTSSPTLGVGAGALGLLRVPSEIEPVEEIRALRRVVDRVAQGSIGAAQGDPSGDRTEDPGRASGVLLAPGYRGTRYSLMAGSSMYNAERGLFDLGQGRPVLVTGRGSGTGEGAESVLVTAVEALDAEQLEALRSSGTAPPRLVVTHHRLAAMGLSPANGNGEIHPAYALPLPGDVDLHRLLELSCAAGPASAVAGEPSPATGAEEAALSLVRLGRLLPAMMAVPVDEPYADELSRALDAGALLRVDVHEVRAFVESAGVEVVPVTEAPVPLAEAADSRFILFREGHGLQEHLAILVGTEADWPDPVPVRLHSACLTGDLFGSLRCDCGEQLRGSMSVFASQGGGVLLYLAQEGRGIGLSNKFRAYTLQEDGLDTIDADSALGFGPDERRYDVAVRILQMLGVERIELLTNNPEKVRAMEDAGIAVVRRRPLHGTLNRHNLPYVRAKVQRAGHWLGDMLSQRISGD